MVFDQGDFDKINEIRKEMNNGILEVNYSNDNNCANIDSLDYSGSLLNNKSEVSSIHYRIGTFDSFKKNMLDRISQIDSDSQKKPLRYLTTRSDKDFTIALFDSWANVLDVLTFYQESIINEGYLRTSTERFSVVQIARPIGYELCPGMSATTFIAFNVASPSSSPSSSSTISTNGINSNILTKSEPIIIDKGIKIQSVPSQGENPQIFETVEKIEAYPEWNSLLPKLTIPQDLSKINTKENSFKIYFAKKYPQLKEGNRLLLELRRPAAIAETKSNSSIANTTAESGACNVLLKLFTISKVESDPNNQFSIAEVIKIKDYEFTICEKCLKNDGKLHDSLKQKEGDDLVISILQSIINTISGNSNSEDLKKENKSWSQNDLIAFAERKGWSRKAFFDLYNIKAKEIIHLNGSFNFVNSFKIRASLFGHNAPAWKSLSHDTQKQLSDYGNWDQDPITIEKFAQLKDGQSGDNSKVYLDNVYSTILSNSWIVFEQQQQASTSNLNDDTSIFLQGNSNETEKPAIQEVQFSPFRVSDTNEETISEFLLTSKVTCLSLNKNHVSSSEDCNLDKLSLSSNENYDWVNFYLRKTTVYAQNEILEISSDIPIEEKELIPISKSITLDKVVDNLFIGQRILITGYLQNNPTEKKSEFAIIESIDLDDDKYHTKILLKDNLMNDYDIRTVKINANIALASHGETKQEILGSGDPSMPQQQFSLKQKPLTFFASFDGSKPKSSLEVTVDGIVWNEVSSLYTTGPDDRIYTVRLDNDGTANIIFGDGNRGSKPTAGIENIIAKYRIGIGKVGLIKENQINILINKPLGVTSATNPLAPAGAEDPEDIDSAKNNASNSISLINGSLLSTKDFENFASSFPLIGKTKGTIFWNGNENIVYLAIASSSGGTVEKNSDLYKNLYNSITSNKDPTTSFYLDTFISTPFSLSVILYIDSNSDSESIKTKVEDMLKAEFSFKKRDFGQDVYKREVNSTIMQIEGIVKSEITELYKSTIDEQILKDQQQSNKKLIDNEDFKISADKPQWDFVKNKVARKYELLTVHPNLGQGGIKIKIIKGEF